MIPGMQKPQQGQVEKLDPNDQQIVEQATAVMQSMLASREQSEGVVQLASSGPDGFANVIAAGMELLAQRREISAEDAPVVALSMTMALVDFLIKIKKFEQGDDALRAVLVAVMDSVAQQYGASDEDLNDLDQFMPGMAQAIRERRGQAQPAQPQQQGMVPGV